MFSSGRRTMFRELKIDETIRSEHKLIRDSKEFKSIPVEWIGQTIRSLCFDTYTSYFVPPRVVEILYTHFDGS